ncbi:MAG: ATP-dependent helicase HrpB, partial [Desulfuromonas sp.]
MKIMQLSLPVNDILDELEQALQSSPAAILQAPPGSGKTTRIPLAFLNASWLSKRRILMLEPRRLAATNAARYMASLRQEVVGQTVGYSIRYERKISAATRIEVMTEGLLTRRIQADPELNGVGLVIFDEFHERSQHADLALALCRDIQQGLREDLRLLIMSATLESGPLAQLLNDCPVITANGRSFPVSIRHVDQDPAGSLAESTARGIRLALAETTGDILAFLPGAFEIERCRELLHDLTGQIRLHPLYGNLPFTEQEAAIRPGTKRKVVLATNIAETSLTIEGVETVVDSGWERRPQFDPVSGMPALKTAPISRASAEQRSGRAGRLGPGVCYRLWSDGTHGALLPFSPPEILHADLAPLAFELASWGIEDPGQLQWLDAPPPGHLAGARQLLQQLGAVDRHGRLTSLGREMIHYPSHPRLARLLVEAVRIGRPGLGSDLVAILSERDLFHQSSGQGRVASRSDLLDRLQLLHQDRTNRTAMVRRAAGFWRRRLNVGIEPPVEIDQLGRLLAVAYPDRLARQRQPGSDRYLLRDGRGAKLSPRT